MMKKVKLFVFMVCIAGFNYAEAQNQNQTSIRKNSISANILGTASYGGLSYERLLYERVSVEIGIGIIGYGFGATAYPLKKVEVGQFNPFIGLKYSNHSIVDGENKSASYLPIGLTFFSKNRLNFSVDLGPSLFHHKSPGRRPTQEERDRYPYSDFGFWGNFKIGYRF